MSTVSAAGLLPAPLQSDVTAAPVPMCDVCAHAISGHDVTATRYCDATQANALSRGCICQLLRSGQ